MDYNYEVSGGLGVAYYIFMLLIAVFTIICLWKIFEKAGKPGWASIIPIYNVLVELEILGRPWWWLLLMFIPVVNIVIAIIIIFDMAKVFGKGTGFGFGLLFWLCRSCGVGGSCVSLLNVGCRLFLCAILAR